MHKEKNIFGEKNFGDTLNLEFAYAYREENFGLREKACDGAKQIFFYSYLKVKRFLRLKFLF